VPVVYPASELVGRVTIAGARQEVHMGWLWWHLDRAGVKEVAARKAALSRQIANVRRLASVRLRGELQAHVREAANDAKRAGERRNDVVHQDWVLRGPDALRAVAELPDFESLDDLQRYVEEWDREAKNSPGWLRLPGRRLDLVPSNTLDELRAVERQLANAADRVSELTFAVASARETGHPAGWISTTSSSV
jgi:hypothetical protein